MRRNEFIPRLARTLVRRRDGLRRNLTAHTRMIAVDNRTVGDTMDAALDCEQDELDSQLAAAESRELEAINTALLRIREGSYGTCENCGKTIPVARLQAVPYTTMCIGCQRGAERFGHEGCRAEHWERIENEWTDDDSNHPTWLERELVEP